MGKASQVTKTLLKDNVKKTLTKLCLKTHLKLLSGKPEMEKVLQIALHIPVTLEVD